MRHDPSGYPVGANSGLFDLLDLLDEEGRQRLLNGATSITFEPGEVIVQEGDPGDALYVIQKGTVDIFTAKGGAELHLAVLGQSACFGEVSLLSGRPRTATVVARDLCTVYYFPKHQIDAILNTYPLLRDSLEKMVLSRANDTIAKITGDDSK